jgi:hypothetical protein
MPKNWINGMRACMATGILHDASEVYLIVPMTVKAAIMDPPYHNVLYMVVNVPRCCGWASSVTSRGAEPWLRFDLLYSAYESSGVDTAENIPETNQEPTSHKHASIY